MDVWKERGVFPPDFLHRVQREIGKRLYGDHASYPVRIMAALL